MGIDRLVALGGDRRIRGNIAVGIDAGALHPAVPDIAIDIGGQRGRLEKGTETKQHGDQKDEGNQPASPTGPPDTADRGEVERTFEQQDQDQVVYILPALEIKPRESEKDKPAAHGVEKRFTRFDPQCRAASPGLSVNRIRIVAFRAARSRRNLAVSGAARPEEPELPLGDWDSTSSP